MVGCTEEEVKEDNVDNNTQQEQIKNVKPESNLDKAYSMVLEAVKGKELEDDESKTEFIKDDDKLIIKLTMKNIDEKELLTVSNEEWNQSIEQDAKETVQILLTRLKEVGITDVKCVGDTYVNDKFITRVDETGIIEDHFNEVVSKIQNNVHEEKEESANNQKVNSNFYISDVDGCYHCKKCDTIPSKAEYKENTCDTCNGNKSNEEIGQCYDCGEFKPISEMTFNGRSYHCGCLENMLSVEEGYNALVNYVKSTYGDSMECQCEITAQGPDTVTAEVLFPDGGGYWGYVEINLRTQEITAYPAN